MRIAVNTRLLLPGRLEGIGWFTYETLKRITSAHPEHEFHFIFDRAFSNEFVFDKNVVPHECFPQARHPFLYFIWFEYSIPSILKKIKADIFLSTDGFISLSTKVPQVDVIHDINFAHYPADLPKLTSWYYNKYFPKYAHRAKRLATVSEYSKQDLVKTYNVSPEKIDVVYNGANLLYRPLSESEIANTRNKYSEGKPYFLFVGALHPRKNVARLLKAFDEFRKSSQSDIKLVIVGGQMFKTGDITETYNSLMFKDQIVFTGRLPAEDLRFVVGAAHTLTFVPYFEGFGIPIVEAMYCNIPVITSNITSMPEVAGNAALLIDPFSVESIKNAMLQIAQESSLRDKLIANSQIQRQKFHWDFTAEKLWQCIEKAIS